MMDGWRMSSAFLVLYLLLVSNSLPCHAEKALNEFINYYEPIVFPSKEKPLAWHPIPIKESESREEIATNTAEELEITAFGREFRLELQRSSRILAADAEVTVLGGTEVCKVEKLSADAFLANLVEGKVVDEPNSYVHGALKKGVFTGIIYLTNQTFFVERATKYFREQMPFDCVIFRQEDLNMTAFDCGLGPEGYKCDPIRLLQRTGPTSEQVLPVLEELELAAEHSWFRRTAPKTICRLKVVADHLFFQHAGDSSAENSIYEMIFHVHEADRIFRGTDFDDDGHPDNIGFRVQSVEVHTSTLCLENPNIAKPTLSSDQYLEIFSERDFHNYCVGVAFSGFTFPGRVLGIAWMADADNSGYVGGICEPRLFSTQDQKALSFNAAVVTVMLEGRRMPRGITAIAVAHELGHSFGSDHDPYQDPICSPGRDEGGKYIMAAFAVKGDQPNNRFFSSCSKKNMRVVLRKKGTCFTAGAALSLCGNPIDSDQSDCDYGVATADPCCMPTNWINSCSDCGNTDHQDTQCNPVSSTGGGCNPRECSFLPYSDINTGDDVQACHITDEECFASITLCEGADWCPTPQKLPDGSACSDGIGECWEGTCVVDPCLAYGELPCECAELERACIVCCLNDEVGSQCRPVRRKDAPWWLLRRPGEPCHQGLGLCNLQGQCEFEGTLPLENKTTAINYTRKENLLESDELAETLADDDYSSLDDDFEDSPQETETLNQIENIRNTKIPIINNINTEKFYDGPAESEPRVAWVKTLWWRRIFVQIMWICLGLLLFFVVVVFICFLCPAMAVGVWCLRQCACWPYRTMDDNSPIILSTEPQALLPTGIFFRPTQHVTSLDIPPSSAQCPTADVQARSRTF